MPRIKVEDWGDAVEGLQTGSKKEKIGKGVRSLRGRIKDDWIIDSYLKGHKKEYEEKLNKALQDGCKYGRVIEVHKRHVFVAEESNDGETDTSLIWLATVAKRHFQRAHKERNFVVVGDRVLIKADRLQTELDDHGNPINTDLPRAVIEHCFTRKNKLCRVDPMRSDWEHIMLTNIDKILVVASVLNPKVRWGLIDRILVQVEQENLEPVIVLNKIDLLENHYLATPEFKEQYNRRIKIYRDIGYEVIEVCALHPEKTPEAVQRLRELFKGSIIGFCGHSGVGKSSIVNLLEPEIQQEVDENPEIFYKGRHTTTYNTLLRLGVGGYVIDTPGIRSFSSVDVDHTLLTWCFREMRNIRCKYTGCKHMAETDCGIKAAVEAGVISEERYRSYLGILGVNFREGEGDDPESDLKADLKAREEWSKTQFEEYQPS